MEKADEDHVFSHMGLVEVTLPLKQFLSNAPDSLGLVSAHPTSKQHSSLELPRHLPSRTSRPYTSRQVVGGIGLDNAQPKLVHLPRQSGRPGLELEPGDEGGHGGQDLGKGHVPARAQVLAAAQGAHVRLAGLPLGAPVGVPRQPPEAVPVEPGRAGPPVLPGRVQHARGHVHDGAPLQGVRLLQAGVARLEGERRVGRDDAGARGAG